jgi:hypothetical protein
MKLRRRGQAVIIMQLTCTILHHPAPSCAIMQLALPITLAA